MVYEVRRVWKGEESENAPQTEREETCERASRGGNGGESLEERAFLRNLVRPTKDSREDWGKGLSTKTRE